MRASRLLSILTTLQARGRVTAQTLADECEVSLRTIYRDVDALSAAGIPIYSERGSTGGYRLLDGYRTRLNGLTAPEAEALFLAGLTRQTTDLGLGPVAATARTKLLAAMPDAIREGVNRTGSRFHLDAPRWFGEAEMVTHLPRVADAVWNEKVVRVRYRSWKGEKERRLEPLGVVLKGGAWYLVARIGPSLRTYRVSRILELEVLDERFTRPEDFDLAAHWAENTRRLEAELHPNEATLRCSPRAVAMMSAFLPPFVCAEAVIDDPEDDGWSVVRLPTGSIPHAAAELLRFGDEVEVLAPEDLREYMTKTVRTLAAIYRLSTGGLTADLAAGRAGAPADGRFEPRPGDRTRSRHEP